MTTRLPIARTLATLLATIASFVSVYVLCRWANAQSSGPAVAAAVFSLGYGRRRTTHGARDLLFVPLVVAFVALAALGVGRLLLVSPIAGAVLFVAGMFLAVYTRNFTGRLRQLGVLIALPLITMLVVPATPAHAPGGPLVDIALGASAGVVSLAFAMLAQAVMVRLGFAAPRAVPETLAPGAHGMTAATKMALQMAVALTIAFALGFAVFPEHWGWTVLTAFIVCSGARGRGDAVYKGVLRLAGAIGGTIVAAIASHIWAPAGIGEAIAIFGLLFFALLLRDVNYAFWAAGSTLILALLARTADGFNLALLGTRLEAILAGAVCAVIATWFVFPIRTEDVIRRRLADALKAFDDVVVHAHDAAARHDHVAHFEHRMTELDGVAPPVRWHRRLFVHSASSEHPADWIDLAREIRRGASDVTSGSVTGEKQRGRLRRAIGASRKAIGQHRDPSAQGRVPIGTALAGLRDTLANLQAGSGAELALGRREPKRQTERARTMQLQPYLFFTGECEAALEFYRSIFGGTIESVNRYGGSPMEEHAPPDWKNKIMHATFKSDGVQFMAADSSQAQPGGGNARARLCVSSADHDEGQRAFDGLAAGGTVTLPYTRQFWGASLGMLTDKFGIEWMINAGGAEAERG
jgi:uncharacterized glyoxalase superfamily protein PhnB